MSALLGERAVPAASRRHATRIRLQEEQAPPAEQELQEAVRRALRKPAGRIAVVMHLSAMTPPAPHAHHRRIARSVMEDAAQRHVGEVHVLANSDTVLLCRLPEDGDPLGFRDALQHLFQVDALQPVLPISIWDLERESEAVLAYVAERLGAPVLAGPLPKASLAHLAGEPDPEPAAEPAEHASVPPPQALGPIAGVLRRQTAIRLERVPERSGERLPERSGERLPERSGERMPARSGERLPERSGEVPRARLRAAFRELSIAMPVLERRVPAVRQARSDPFLMRSLAAELDVLLLDALAGDLADTAGLRPAAGEAAMPLHLNLSFAGIMSPAFARFAAAGLPAAIEVPLMEIVADPQAFAAARARVAAAGFPLVLDGISHLALSLIAPAALRPDVLKLEWSPRLLRAPLVERERIDTVLEAMAPERIVLDRVDSEEAIRWALTRDIRVLQGRYIDVLAATQRMVTCAAGSACTLRQCAGRAEAAEPQRRSECGNTRLLDQGPGPDPADLMAAAPA